jgi:hypothetical protein
MRKTAEQRFWEKVDRRADDECWNWTGAKSDVGYGQIRISGKIVGAHRFSWEQFSGQALGALMIDHRCHNRACVNPAHLRVATHKQNSENLLGAHRDSRIGVRGVRRTHAVSERWDARVHHNGKTIQVGTFGSVAEAEAAVRAKRSELFTHNDSDRQAG